MAPLEVREPGSSARAGRRSIGAGRSGQSASLEAATHPARAGSFIHPLRTPQAGTKRRISITRHPQREHDWLVYAGSTRGATTIHVVFGADFSSAEAYEQDRTAVRRGVEPAG
jgi:hypothetical protein